MTDDSGIATGSSGPAPRPHATGKMLVHATWQLLKQDRDLILLPVVGGFASLAALVMLAAPGFAIGWAAGNSAVGVGIGGVLGVFAAASVGIYFQAALVLGAFQRADGHDPSLGSTLREVWPLRRRILQWALVSTTVGFVIRLIEQRLGGVLGAILGFLGGLAWAIASFLTVPVLVAEGLGPVTATRRSVALIKQRWGVSLRSTLRVGAWQIAAILASLAGLLAGVVALASGGIAAEAIGAVLILAATLALAGTVILTSAVFTYVRAILYRFSVGLPVPGIPAELYTGAFTPKRRWWGRR
jgi:hypothetical protein